MVVKGFCCTLWITDSSICAIVARLTYYIVVTTDCVILMCGEVRRAEEQVQCGGSG